MKRSVFLILLAVVLLGAAPGIAEAAELITSRQIKDGTIQLRDLSPKARKSLRGQAGPAGPAGSFKAVTTVKAAWAVGNGSKIATCPPGTSVVAGGIQNTRTNTRDMQVLQSYPTGNGWYVEILSAPTTSGTQGTGVWTYAVCAS